MHAVKTHYAVKGVDIYIRHLLGTWPGTPASSTMAFTPQCSPATAHYF